MTDRVVVGNSSQDDWHATFQVNCGGISPCGANAPFVGNRELYTNRINYVGYSSVRGPFPGDSDLRVIQFDHFNVPHFRWVWNETCQILKQVAMIYHFVSDSLKCLAVYIMLRIHSQNHTWLLLMKACKCINPNADNGQRCSLPKTKEIN